MRGRFACQPAPWRACAGGLPQRLPCLIEPRHAVSPLAGGGPLAPVPSRAQLTEQGFNECTTNQNDSLGDAFWNVVGTPGLAGFVYHRMVDHPLEAASGLEFGL